MVAVTVSKKPHRFTAGQGENNNWQRLSSWIVSPWSNRTRWKHVMNNGTGWEVKHPPSTKKSMSRVSGATTWDSFDLMLCHKLMALRAEVDVCDCGRLAVIMACHKRVAWRRQCQEPKSNCLLGRTGLTSPLWYLDRQIKRTTVACRILAKRWQTQQVDLELICFKDFPVGKSVNSGTRASLRGVPLKENTCWSRGVGNRNASCDNCWMFHRHSTANDSTWLQNNPMSPTSITSDISSEDQFGKEFQIWFSDVLSQNMGAINGQSV